jgi:SAM-dependent methyltransferase
MSCHLCGGDAFETLFEAKDRLRLTDRRFEVRRCLDCGLSCTWPPATEEDLAEYYPTDYWGERAEPSHEWILRTQREKTSVVERHLPNGGRILDVGCGAGFFLRALDPARWDRWGVEIGTESATVADKHVGPNRVFAGRMVDAPLALTSFDVVAFWASLEHLVAPKNELQLARRLLRPSGRLVVQVPNAASTQARRFGADWFALDVPRHRYHFSPVTLERLLRENGFEVAETLFTSETHDAHALKQSLKARLIERGAPFGRARYYALAPFVRIANRIDGGATLTVTARPR